MTEPSHDTVALGSLTIKKTLGFADLTSVSGYFDRVAQRQEDGTYFNSTAFAEFFLDTVYPAQQPVNDSVIANLPSAVEIRTQYQQFTQELRLTSDLPGPLNFLLGAFYFNEHINEADQLTYGSRFAPYANALIEGATGCAAGAAEPARPARREAASRHLPCGPS